RAKSSNLRCSRSWCRIGKMRARSSALVVSSRISNSSVIVLDPSGHHEVVAVHGFVAGVRHQLAHGLGLQSLDPAQLVGAVVDDALGDRRALGDNFYRIAR